MGNLVIDAIKSRRSVRDYQPGEVSREQLETIVDCGRLAPSAMNKQTWEFVVVTQKSMLQQLAKAMPINGPFLTNAGACIVVAGQKSHRSVYLDGAAAVENMLLAISAMGLGGCWIQAYEKEYDRQLRELLAIPDNLALVTVISIGNPSGDRPPPRKRPLADVLHWEKF